MRVSTALPLTWRSCGARSTGTGSVHGATRLTCGSQPVLPDQADQRRQLPVDGPAGDLVEEVHVVQGHPARAWPQSCGSRSSERVVLP